MHSAFGSPLSLVTYVATTQGGGTFKTRQTKNTHGFSVLIQEATPVFLHHSWSHTGRSGTRSSLGPAVRGGQVELAGLWLCTHNMTLFIVERHTVDLQWGVFALHHYVVQ